MEPDAIEREHIIQFIRSYINSYETPPPCIGVYEKYSPFTKDNCPEKIEGVPITVVELPQSVTHYKGSILVPRPTGFQRKKPAAFGAGPRAILIGNAGKGHTVERWDFDLAEDHTPKEILDAHVTGIIEQWGLSEDRRNVAAEGLKDLFGIAKAARRIVDLKEPPREVPYLIGVSPALYLRVVWGLALQSVSFLHGFPIVPIHGVAERRFVLFESPAPEAMIPKQDSVKKSRRGGRLRSVITE